MDRREPTLREVIAGITDEGELTGLVGQVQHDNRWTKEIENLVEARRAEIRKGKGWK